MLITFKLFAAHDQTGAGVIESWLSRWWWWWCWRAVMQIRSKRKPKNEQMYYRPDSNPPGAVAWRRTGGQGVWSTEQEVAMLSLQSFVIIEAIIIIIIIIILIIKIITTIISTGIIYNHHRCWSHQRAGTAQASTHAQHTTSLGCLDQGRSSLMLNVSWIWIYNIFL